MTLPIISPMNAKRLLDRGAILVDIREAHEVARERVPGSHHAPLSRLSTVDAGDAPAVIFHCRSGARTAANARRLSGATDCSAFVLEGGLDAWKRAGLPVQAAPRRPINITNQAQITSAFLIVLGVVLGLLVAPAFLVLAGVVGAALLFGGVTGSCLMAELLKLMPWNRRGSDATA